ncbi:MAG: PAS domain S-box protein, partial [Dehalococcoidales bacterium]
MRRPAETWGAAPRAASGAPASGRRKQTTPRRRLIATAVVLFVAEALVMVLFIKWPLRPPFDIVVDAALLVGLTVPALYFFLVRPLARQSEARRGAEENLELQTKLLDLASDSVFLHDTEGNFAYVNEAAHKALGYTRDELMQLNLSDLVAPDEKDGIGNRINQTTEMGGAIFESVHRRKDGTLLPIEVQADSVEFGGRRLLIAVARDITRHKHAEETIRQSEQRYRAIFDTAANLITSVDRRGVIVDCNARVSSFLGYTQEEIIGQPMSKIIHADYLAKAEESLAKILTTGFSYDQEYKMVRRDGSLIDVSANSSALRNGQGGWSKTVCIISDVTTARRMEEAVRNAYAELERVFNTAGNGMRVVDIDFNVIRVNDSYAEMSMVRKQDTVNRRCYEDFPGPLCHTAHCTLRRIIGGEERVESEVEKERSDGTRITCMRTATALRNSENQLLGMVEDYKDITELKKTREHLQHSQVLASLGEMTAGIAHEVNNPLGSILLYSELLVASDVDPRVRKDLRIIHDEARRATQVMTNLLAYSRKVKSQTRRLDLHKMLKKLVSMRRYSQRVQNVTLETDFQPAPLYLAGDSTQLRQLFMNLVLNAEEAVKECAERRITISTRTEGDWAKIVIADTGPGIPEKNLEQV